MRYILLIAIITLLGCASKKDVKTTESVTTEAESIDDKLETPEIDVQSIQLMRGACYGTCPIYKVVFTNYGNVTYTGKDYVEMVGTYSTLLTKADIDVLFEKVNALDWLVYPDEYPIDNYDFPQFSMSVIGKDLNRKIKCNTNSPKEIIELAKYMDELVEKLDFMPID